MRILVLAIVVSMFVFVAQVKAQVAELSSSDYIEIKMGELEKQFAILTDEVERLKHNFSLLEQKFARMNADADVRFKELEKKAVTVKEEPKPVPLPVAQLTPKQEYDAAYEMLKKNDFAKAEKAFADFVKKYPHEDLAGNAQYWLGETFYVRKDYEKAVVAFAEAYQKYPKNHKAPDNFLKLGLSMQALGKKSEACTVFKNFVKEYPQAPAAFRQRAEKEAGKLGCK